MKGSMTGIIRQRYCPMKGFEQVASADVLHQMFVFVGVVTERAVVVPEAYGSFCVGVFHRVSNPRLWSDDE